MEPSTVMYDGRMVKRLRQRRSIVLVAAIIGVTVLIFQSPDMWRVPVEDASQFAGERGSALVALDELETKGRAPKTGYQRTQFGSGWSREDGCDTRNRILARDMRQLQMNERCQVTRGSLEDPYTGKVIQFVRGSSSSSAVQIDHVVALSNAWQTGAQQLSEVRRVAFANDPLNLLAVDGPANQQKGDGDAATWLPSSVAFRCQYVARQIAVKQKYSLWVVLPEKEAMQRVLRGCPAQSLPLAFVAS